jgi:hypothetical protein
MMMRMMVSMSVYGPFESFDRPYPDRTGGRHAGTGAAPASRGADIEDVRAPDSSSTVGHRHATAIATSRAAAPPASRA